jgi:hypothetical protein
MLNQTLKEKILKNSISLEKLGLCDLAWNKTDALEVIRSIEKDKIGILGGDVYRLNLSRVEPTYENWYCNPRERETEEEYYLRSKIKALQYIEEFQVNRGDPIVFSLTFTEEII